MPPPDTNVIALVNPNISNPKEITGILAAEADQPHCQPGALTDFYGLIAQVILAGLAFASLVLKRACEPAKRRRPWVIWFFDTSKQATGAGVIHMLNVFLADLFYGDPCTWYIVSFLLDSSLGLVIIFICVKLVSFIARVRNYPTLRFGEYGSPPSCQAWFHQCVAFVVITVVEKILIVILLQLSIWNEVRRVILSPITNAHLEMIIVMLVVPFITNVFIFWVVDNLIMQKVGALSASGSTGHLGGNQKRKKPLAFSSVNGNKLLSSDQYHCLDEDNSDEDGCTVRLLDSNSSDHENGGFSMAGTIIAADEEIAALRTTSFSPATARVNNVKHRNGSMTS